MVRLGALGAEYRRLLDSGAVKSRRLQALGFSLAADGGYYPGPVLGAASSGVLIVNVNHGWWARAGQAVEVRVFGHQPGVLLRLLHNPLDAFAAEVIGDGPALPPSHHGADMELGIGVGYILVDDVAREPG